MSDQFLLSQDIQGVPLQTVRLYLEKVTPFSSQMYSKDNFLNKCVDELYLKAEATLYEKKKDIEKMQKSVSDMDEIREILSIGGADDPELIKQMMKEEGKKYKSTKKKMCPFALEKKKCPEHKEGKCAFAHTPIELTVVKTDTKKKYSQAELDSVELGTKIKNMKKVIDFQSKKLKNMTPLTPWKPAKGGEIYLSPDKDPNVK